MSIKGDLQDVCVSLGGTPILHDVSLEIPAGSFLTLLGPSGSGKTTTLNVLAGFVSPQSGHVLFDGEPVDKLPPERRSTGIVFQDYALFPHLTVEQNVEFPLKARRVPRAERLERVNRMLELVQLPGTNGKRITTLSGGQRQRVAVARALVFEPRLLLLDEPLAALDKHLRESMQVELRGLQEQLGITTVAVTHDQAEALVMSDLVAIMRAGAVEQVGTPKEVYKRPRTRFVATFLGEANLLRVDDPLVAALGIGWTAQGGDAEVLLRPEDLRLERPEDAPDRPAFYVRRIEFHGARLRISVNPDIRSSTEDLTVSLEACTDAEAWQVGDRVALACDPRAAHVIDPENAAPPAMVSA
ncbi:MAG: ABC transporter ATP-binding protein [Actinobacteria bacterium]|nr:ABC transporter ATP-binding protein [Actinomycetota bacterium]